MSDGCLPASRFDWERVIRRVALPWPTRAVGLLLATYADTDGTRVHPGNERLMAVTGASESTVIRHMKILREKGFLTITRNAYRKGGFSNEYRLTVPSWVFTSADVLPPEEVDEHPVKLAPVQGMESDDQVGKPGTDDTYSQMRTVLKLSSESPKPCTSDGLNLAPVTPHQPNHQPLPTQITEQLESPPREAAAANLIPGPGHPDYQPSNPTLAEYRANRKAGK